MCTRQTRKLTAWSLLIGLLCCFGFASLVHDEFSRLHVLLKYSLCLLRPLLESGVYFIQHELRCNYCSRAATNREQRLIEWIQYVCVTSHKLIKYVLIICHVTEIML